MSDAPTATPEMVSAATEAFWRSKGGVRGDLAIEAAINAALRVMREQQAKPAHKFRVGQVWECRDKTRGRVTISEIDDRGHMWDGVYHRSPDGRFWKDVDYDLDLVKLISDAPEPQAVDAAKRIEVVRNAIYDDGVQTDPTWAEYYENIAKACIAAYDALRRLESEEAAS